MTMVGARVIWTHEHETGKKDSGKVAQKAVEMSQKRINPISEKGFVDLSWRDSIFTDEANTSQGRWLKRVLQSSHLLFQSNHSLRRGHQTYLPTFKQLEIRRGVKKMTSET